MTYQIIYSSKSTVPMQSDDLDALLVHARDKNATRGISGALVYAEGIFLQVLEGDEAVLNALMKEIRRDLRHDTLAILREGEIPSARFSNWNMAYISATRAQVARWAGIDGLDDGTGIVDDDVSEDGHRTSQFAQDILALLQPGEYSSARDAP